MRTLVVFALLSCPLVAQAASPVRVYLNRDGATLVAGRDDPARGRSLIAGNGDGGQVTIPPFAGGDRRWRSVVACVRRQFAPFAVDIVDARPTTGDYTMIMVGGGPALLGMGDGISGIAPADAEVLRNAVGFALSDAVDSDPDATCATIAHETGHTLGLDHARACGDLMSYEDCGPKRFLDQSAACGEYEDRACDSGQATQNSYQYLARAVGLRGAPTDPATDDDDAIDDDASDDGDAIDDASDADDSDADASDADASDASDDSDDDDSDDASDDAIDDASDRPTYPGCTHGGHASAPPVVAPAAPAAPQIELDTHGDQVAGDRWIEIDVRASAPDGVADVALAWASPDGTFLWSCAAPPDDAPVLCRQRGDRFHFFLRVGLGERAVAAVVTDGGGRQTASEPRSLVLAAR